MGTSGKSVYLCLILNMWDSLAYERLVDRDGVLAVVKRLP